jgi:hypothetical protein
MKITEELNDQAIETRTSVLVAVNIFAIVVYLLAASVGWVESEVADIPGASGGGALLWAMLAIPIFLMSLLVNLSAATWLLIYRWRYGQWYFLWGTFVVVPVPWILAVAYDFSRHGS